MKRVQQHYELMVRIQKHRNVFSSYSTRVSQATDTESSRQIASSSDDNMVSSEPATP